MQVLTDEQKSAVLHDIDSSSVIEAGPGSGKTQTLAYRIYHLLQAGVAPTSILVLAFTRNAAQELSNRVRSLHTKKSETVPTENCSTIHSFALSVLRALPSHEWNFPHFPKGHFFQRLEFACKEDRLRLVYQAWQELKKEGGSSSNSMTNMISESNSMWLQTSQIEDNRHLDNDGEKGGGGASAGSRHHATAENTEQNVQCARLVERKKKEFLKKFVARSGRASSKSKKMKSGRASSKSKKMNVSQDFEVRLFERYQYLLGIEGKIDYDDATHYLYVKLCENDEILRILHSGLQYIVVDECQDLDELQLKLIRLLCGYSQTHSGVWLPKIIAVGDSNQSIYESFRGGQGSTVFSSLLNKKPSGMKMHHVRLRKNFRSLHKIVQLSNKLMETTMETAVNCDDLPRGLGSNGVVELTVYDEQRGAGRQMNELECVAKKIKQMKGDGTVAKWSDIMVLCKRNKDLNEFRDILESQHIPHKKSCERRGKGADDAVVVSTIHGAKGTEALNVFIIRCQAPLGFNTTDKDEAEARRLLYVAMTRAKYRCFLSATEHLQRSVRPSIVFQQLQKLQRQQQVQENMDEEELEDDDDTAPVIRGKVYKVRWPDDGKIYEAKVTKILSKKRVRLHWFDGSMTDMSVKDFLRSKVD